MDREREPTEPATPWSRDAGPEPEWAEAIRQGRKARGDRLRAVFESFGDDEPAPRPSADSGSVTERAGAEEDEAP